MLLQVRFLRKSESNLLTITWPDRVRNDTVNAAPGRRYEINMLYVFVLYDVLLAQTGRNLSLGNLLRNQYIFDFLQNHLRIYGYVSHICVSDFEENRRYIDYVVSYPNSPVYNSIAIILLSTY